MSIPAMSRIPPREPAPTLEQRVAILERRITDLDRQVRYYEELSDEHHYRIVDLEAALDRAPVAA